MSWFHRRPPRKTDPPPVPMVIPPAPGAEPAVPAAEPPPLHAEPVLRAQIILRRLFRRG